MRKEFLLSVVLSLIVPTSLYSEPEAREITLGAQGEVVSLTVSVEPYIVVFDARGFAKSVSVNMTTGYGRTCTFSEDRIIKSEDISKECKFAQGRVSRVGDVAFAYNAQGQILSVGPLKFSYENKSSRPNRMAQVGVIYFSWRDGYNKLSSVNDVVLSYDDKTGMLTGLDSRLIALGDWFSKYKVKITVTTPVEVFRF
jgi:hypothetical protein